jgi:hypothetical protein
MATKVKKSGARYALLLYRRTMDRVWKNTLVLGVILLALWYLPLLPDRSLGWISSKDLLLAGAIVVLALCAFAFLGRSMVYVQAMYDHLRLVTPFLRLNVSYRRITSTHPVMIQQLFPPQASGWAQRRFLEPFYGKTAILIELSGYPLNPTLLKLFLPAQMFSPRSTGLVILVSDWMQFSTEFDTLVGNWLQSQKNRPQNPGSFRMR